MSEINNQGKKMRNNMDQEMQRVHNISYSANSLINVGIMHTSNSGDRNAFFIMMSLIPGATSNTSESGRTFVMQKAVNMKLSPEKLDAVSEAMAALAQGRGQFFGDKFTIFTDPSKSNAVTSDNSNKKSMNIAYPTTKSNNGQPETTIVITVKSGQNSISVPIPPLDAIGFSKAMSFLASKCRELEYSRSIKKLSQKSGNNRN